VSREKNNTIGIIAEFNPLHNGHIYLIKQARKIFKDHILIIALSGNFVQRGEPAIIDKYIRARWCLKSGADIVVEIPTSFVLQSADFFAQGAITLLKGIKCQNIIFGSESANYEKLDKIANIQENEGFKERINQSISSGASYPTAYAYALKDNNIELTPNDILGACYIRAIKRTAPKMKYKIIKRFSSGYYNESSKGTITSASHIRKIISSNSKEAIRFLPNYVLNDINKISLPSIKKLYEIFKQQLIFNTFPLSEGLHNRFLKNVYEKDFESFLNKVLCPRYTNARIKREMINSILRIDNSLLSRINIKGSRYARILGLSYIGRKYIKSLPNKFPLITNFKENNSILKGNSKLSSSMMNIDIKADHLYYFICEKDISNILRVRPVFYGRT